MEAVIAAGGKQYRVSPGQVISVEKVPGDKGAVVEFKSVLFVNRDGEVLTGPQALQWRPYGAKSSARLAGARCRSSSSNDAKTIDATVGTASRSPRCVSRASRSSRHGTQEGCR